MGELVLFPTANGDVIMLGVNPLALNFQNVDEWPHDGDETYVAHGFGGNWAYDLYKLSLSNPPPAGSISNVSVRSYCSVRNVSYTARIRHVIKTHGNIYLSSSWYTNYNPYWERAWDLSVNPSTGQSWTWSEIACIQFGVWLNANGSAGSVACTSIRVAVTFSETASKEGADSFALVDSGVKEVIVSIEKTGSDSLILTDSGERIIAPLVPVAIFVIKERRTERLS